MQDTAEELLGRLVTLPGHFEGEVKVEAARELTGGYELRVRLTSGHLEETVISASELQELIAGLGEGPAS